jgi:RNA polymerase sigma factor (TIGR02999 family)
MGDITELLDRARDGDSQALDAVFDALYDELRQMARSRLRTHPKDVLLDTAGVVNDCYLRFVRTRRVTPADRHHFLAYCSQAMRSVIVDMVRASRRERRGGKVFHTSLSVEPALDRAIEEVDVLDVHEALNALAQIDPRLAQVVEMRYFGGLTEKQIGEILGLTDRTIRRDWEKARLYLAAALEIK